jgi:hypothetical protein
VKYDKITASGEFILRRTDPGKIFCRTATTQSQYLKDLLDEKYATVSEVSRVNERVLSLQSTITDHPADIEMPLSWRHVLG